MPTETLSENTKNIDMERRLLRIETSISHCQRELQKHSEKFASYDDMMMKMAINQKLLAERISKWPYITIDGESVDKAKKTK